MEFAIYMIRVQDQCNGQTLYVRDWNINSHVITFANNAKEAAPIAGEMYIRALIAHISFQEAKRFKCEAIYLDQSTFS